MADQAPQGHRENEPIEPLMSLKGDGGWVRRVKAGIVFSICLGVLIVAANLRADKRGMGTHQQLGLHECQFKLQNGYPCPTCGMTTAFTHAASGRLIASAGVQPAGMILAILTAMSAIVSGYILVTGSAVMILVWSMVKMRMLIAGLLLLLGLGWGYTIVIHTLMK